MAKIHGQDPKGALLADYLIKSRHKFNNPLVLSALYRI